MYFVKIDESNKELFSHVLPESMIDGLGISIGAILDGVTVGAVSLSFNGEEYSIDWLYVAPSERLKGVGRGLIHEVRSMVSDIGICPIRMALSSSDDSGLFPFVLAIDDEDNPIDITYSHDRYVISATDFSGSKGLDKVLGSGMFLDYETGSFMKEDAAVRGNLLSEASEIFTVSDVEKFVSTCENDLCLVAKKKGEIYALALVQRESENVLRLSYLHSKNPKALTSLLQDLLAVLSEYPDDMVIYFDTVTVEAILLANKLFPDAKKEAIYDIEF